MQTYRSTTHNLAPMRQKTYCQPTSVAPQGVIQRWGPSDHRELTETVVKKTLSAFEGFQFDEGALKKLTGYSTDMDLKVLELAFNVGSKIAPFFRRAKQQKLKALQKYYAQHAPRAQHHGEGGLYTMTGSQAAAENVPLQEQYEAQVRAIFQQLSKTFYSAKECESTKSAVRESILQILGDALHVAQDRGAHGEGAAGQGHAKQILEGVDPDDKGENKDGYIKAQRNTELLVLQNSDLLYKLLDERYPRTCSYVQRSHAILQLQRRYGNHFVRQVVNLSQRDSDKVQNVLVQPGALPTTVQRQSGEAAAELDRERQEIAVDLQAKAERGQQREDQALLALIHNLLHSLGFSPEQEAKLLQGKAIAVAPSPTVKAVKAKPKESRHRLIYGENFADTLDGISLKASLFEKIKRMAAYALENDLVTGNIVLSSGMRSPKEAHRWSTAYQIRQGNVSIARLTQLPAGKDLDGNLWYQPGWTLKEVKANANEIWSGALAAEGYPKGDPRRAPNPFAGGVTRHATGKAIDATFLWNWKQGESQTESQSEKVSQLKAVVEKKWAHSPKKEAAVLASIDKFIGRGSYSDIAYKTVAEFGLVRPVLHATGSPEDWHYEEK